LDIMRLKITARELLVTKIQDMNGRVSITFSPDTRVEPKDILEIGKSGDGRVRFLPEGFDLDLRGFAWGEVYKNISKAMNGLKKSVSLLV